MSRSMSKGSSSLVQAGSSSSAFAGSTATPSVNVHKMMESKHKPLVILRCKVLVVGDACVGKTALTQVFQSGGSTYPKNYMMTIGVEFIVKQVPIPDTNAVVELFIYDCAGQSIFNQIEMNSKYYDNVSAIMVVYDITRRDTFHSLPKWYQSITASRGGTAVPGVMVGNKCEFRDGTIDTRAEVVREEAERLAVDLGLAYYESSAANNVGVDDPLMHICRDFHRRYEESVRKAEELSSTLAF